MIYIYIQGIDGYGMDLILDIYQLKLPQSGKWLEALTLTFFLAEQFEFFAGNAWYWHTEHHKYFIFLHFTNREKSYQESTGQVS